jgi:hypothetical protein
MVEQESVLVLNAFVRQDQMHEDPDDPTRIPTPNT